MSNPLSLCPLADRVGITTVDHYGTEYFFAMQIEQGLKLIGESMTEAEYEALSVVLPSTSEQHPGNVSGVQLIGAMLGQAGVLRWTNKVEHGLKAQYVATVIHSGKRGKEQQQKIDLWIDNVNLLVSHSQRIMLVWPVQSWVKNGGANQTRKAAALGCLPGVLALTTLFVIAASVL